MKGKNMGNKVLTISIAAYNVEKYLDQTLKSIVASNVTDDLEAIIVNDGSKDNTAAKAEKYIEEYPDTFILINKENGGWGSTVNASINIAKGKYFKLLDGDDWVDSEGLAEFVNRLKNIDTDCVFTNYTEVYEKNMNKNLIEPKYEKEKIFSVKEVNRFCMHILSVKTKLLKDNNVRLLEHCFYTDLEFFTRSIMFANTVIYIPVNVYCYRLGLQGQSVSIQGYSKHIKEHDLVMRTLFPLIYSNENLVGMKDDMNTFASIHICYLLSISASNENRKMLVEFFDFVKKNYPDTIKKFSLNQKLIMMCPKLFYRPIVALKRMKNKYWH